MRQHTKFAVLTFFSGTTFLAPVTAEETYSLEVSSNIGILSDYVFRGVYQSDASANGGVDLGYGPVYLGT